MTKQHATPRSANVALAAIGFGMAMFALFVVVRVG